MYNSSFIWDTIDGDFFHLLFEHRKMWEVQGGDFTMYRA